MKALLGKIVEHPRSNFQIEESSAGTDTDSDADPDGEEVHGPVVSGPSSEHSHAGRHCGAGRNPGL